MILLPPPILVCDVETYRNYFLLMFRNVYSGAITYFESWPGKPLSEQDLIDISRTFHINEIITFNGINYDFPIISLALSGVSNTLMKDASDDIITGGLKPWQIADKYGGVDLSEFNHVDLIEVAPGQCSLKIYGGRLHSKRMQDLPIEHTAMITPEQRVELVTYCKNDLQTTIDLYLEIKPQVDLRREMSKEFDKDVRSKSDAQIAEVVIRSEVEKRKGLRVWRQELHPQYSFKYRVPDFVSFHAPGMRHILDIIRKCEFSLSEAGKVVTPKAMLDMRIRIGHGLYKFGIGGLHSCEKSTSHFADDKTLISDMDVTSYYPACILNQNLCPSNMGEDFIEVYRSLVKRRVAAKKAGNNVVNETIKVVINGSFGKFGSKWSILYAPDLMIQVTLTGQLAILMLIEAIEAAGMPVISANTDGLVIKYPESRRSELEAIVKAWSMLTGFDTEESRYSALLSKDVNNYLAIGLDGKVKQKGLYAFVGSKKSKLEKNPTNFVCVEAVIAKLTKGVPISHTVYECKDIKKFVSVKKVNGGGVYDNEFLGKAVRWYYAKGETRNITYKVNGNKVGRSDGCRPLMELPDHLPDDLEHEWYIREAQSIMEDLGCGHLG